MSKEDIPVPIDLTAEQLRRLHRLADLTDEELEAVANVGTGAVTLGRIRRWAVTLLATIGAATTAWLGLVHLLEWYRSH